MRDEYFLPVVLIICLSITGIFFYDSYSGYEIMKRAVVLDKSYQASTSGTAVGVGAGSNGQPTTVVAASSSPEVYTLIVKMEDEIFSVKVHPTVYVYHDKGSTIYLYRKTGGLIGIKGDWRAEEEYQ